jgi:type VI protein secretion system component Hcp
MSEKDIRHRLDEDAAEDLELGDEAAEQVGGGTGGSGAGKVSTSELVITKKVDVSSPNLST